MIKIRASIAEDASAIFTLAESESLFNQQDSVTVQELFHDYVERGDHNGYFFLSALADEALIGFACYGPTPLTQGTFDLYWINVVESWKGKGVGRQLMTAVIEAVRKAAGRLMVLDTSGHPDYAPTRAFYVRCGFHPAATIPDFYAPGDDLVIYTLPLAD
ncbi:MAG TPA: GNAT family N-acetyltransferase [Anaerolineales bacterium]|nr:GNAT family N-acetyltransferase [Anaerolineales bacterium]